MTAEVKQPKKDPEGQGELRQKPQEGTWCNHILKIQITCCVENRSEEARVEGHQRQAAVVILTRDGGSELREGVAVAVEPKG